MVLVEPVVPYVESYPSNKGKYYYGHEVIQTFREGGGASCVPLSPSVWLPPDPVAPSAKRIYYNSASHRKK